MWTSYFPNPGTFILIQQTPAEPYLDGFVAALVGTGYRPGTIQRYLRSAAHLSYWQRGRARSLADLETPDVDEFKEHLRACECERFNRVNDYDRRGARAFLRYLQEASIIPAVRQAASGPTMPPLFLQFCEWMRRHHGVRNTTLNTYRRTIVDVLQTLGSNPQDFAIADLRAFVLDRASRHGRSQARVVITALRAFIRFLIAQGQCQVGLDVAIPTIAGWRLSALPRYLPAADVERVLGACDPGTVTGARDRAILLLLGHSCALSILQSTGDIRKVALWLGHASTQTTEMYLRADTTTLLETMNSIVPPTLRKGHFRAHQLIELLRTG
jgi:hypothetical protein